MRAELVALKAWIETLLKVVPEPEDSQLEKFVNANIDKDADGDMLVNVPVGGAAQDDPQCPISRSASLEQMIKMPVFTSLKVTGGNTDHAYRATLMANADHDPSEDDDD